MFGARLLYLATSFSSPAFTRLKYSFPSYGFTFVLKVSVPSLLVMPVGVKVGVSTKGLCFAVTVTFLSETVKELFSVVGLVSVTSLEVHFLKGMGSPLLPALGSGVMFTVSPVRKFPLPFAYLTPVPVSVPFSTITV